MAAFYILLVACIVAISCSTIGTFLVLRRNSMLADAISHAVLPGIVIMYIFTGSKDSYIMLFGATVFGVIASALIDILSQKLKVQADASIGVVFTFLFAIGVVMISTLAGQSDLDQDCVLYGELSYVPLSLVTTKSGLVLGPYSLYTSGLGLLIVLGFVTVFYKELKVTTFDSAFAETAGIKASAMHYLLIALVSMVTVVSFEAIGAILVVALLTVPAACAWLLTTRLINTLTLAAFFAIIICFVGYYIAVVTGGTISGAMCIAAGLCFCICLAITKLKANAKTKALV